MVSTNRPGHRFFFTRRPNGQQQPGELQSRFSNDHGEAGMVVQGCMNAGGAPAQD